MSPRRRAGHEPYIMIEILGEDDPVAGAPGWRSGWSAVPWRTIVGSVAVVAATVAAILLVMSTARVVMWVAVAGFLAVVLAPAVALVQQHVGGRRTLATAIVMFTTAFAVIGMLAVFVWPVRQQAISTVADLPGTIDAAAQGQGPVGRTVEKLHLQGLVRDHRADLQSWTADLEGSTVTIARRVVDMVP